MKCVDWMKTVYPNELGKRFVDEDEGDEDGEDFLSKAWDETHQEAALAGNNDHHNDDEPQSNPHSRNYILNLLGLAELNEGNWGSELNFSMHCTTVKTIDNQKWDDIG